MLTAEYVKDLKWANAEHTAFECVVKYVEFEDEHPSGITSNDIYVHTQEIWTKGNAGEYGVIAEYVSPEVVAAENQPTVDGAQTL